MLINVTYIQQKNHPTLALKENDKAASHAGKVHGSIELLHVGLYTIFQSMRLENEQQQKQGAGGITTSCPRRPKSGGCSVPAATETRQNFLQGTTHVLVWRAVQTGTAELIRRKRAAQHFSGRKPRTKLRCVIFLLRSHCTPPPPRPSPPIIHTASAMYGRTTELFHSDK